MDTWSASDDRRPLLVLAALLASVACTGRTSTTPTLTSPTTMSCTAASPAARRFHFDGEFHANQPALSFPLGASSAGGSWYLQLTWPARVATVRVTISTGTPAQVRANVTAQPTTTVGDQVTGVFCWTAAPGDASLLEVQAVAYTGTAAAFSGDVTVP